MFSFDNTLKFNNKEIDVFTIGELLVDMILMIVLIAVNILSTSVDHLLTLL